MECCMWMNYVACKVILPTYYCLGQWVVGLIQAISSQILFVLNVVSLSSLVVYCFLLVLFGILPNLTSIYLLFCFENTSLICPLICYILAFFWWILRSLIKTHFVFTNLSMSLVWDSLSKCQILTMENRHFTISNSLNLYRDAVNLVNNPISNFKFSILFTNSPI